MRIVSDGAFASYGILEGVYQVPEETDFQWVYR